MPCCGCGQKTRSNSALPVQDHGTTCAAEGALVLVRLTCPLCKHTFWREPQRSRSFILGDGAKRHDHVRTGPGPAPSFTSGLLPPTCPRNAAQACWWHMPRRCSLSKRFDVREGDTAFLGKSFRNFCQRNVLLHLCAGEDATSAETISMPSLWQLCRHRRNHTRCGGASCIDCIAHVGSFY